MEAGFRCNRKILGLDVAPALKHGGHEAGLAQLVEHLICNQGATGSNPVAGTSVFNDLVDFRVLAEG